MSGEDPLFGDQAWRTRLPQWLRQYSFIRLLVACSGFSPRFGIEFALEEDELRICLVNSAKSVTLTRQIQISSSSSANCIPKATYSPVLTKSPPPPKQPHQWRARCILWWTVLVFCSFPLGQASALPVHLLRSATARWHRWRGAVEGSLSAVGKRPLLCMVNASHHDSAKLWATCRN